MSGSRSFSYTTLLAADGSSDAVISLCPVQNSRFLGEIDHISSSTISPI